MNLDTFEVYGGKKLKGEIIPQGVLIRHQEQYEKVETFDDCVVLHLKSGKKIKADAILWCNGRTGNTDGLGLENLGVTANSRGQVTVDKQYRTNAQHVFAAGDVIGWPSLASAAYDQGRCAAAHIVGRRCAGRGGHAGATAWQRGRHCLRTARRCPGAACRRRRNGVRGQLVAPRAGGLSGLGLLPVPARWQGDGRTGRGT